MTNEIKNSCRCILFVAAALLSGSPAKAQGIEEAIVKCDVKTPALIRKGELFNIDVLFTVKPNWFIYAPTSVNAALGVIGAKVIFLLPDGITRATKMKLPEPIYKNGHEVYEGNNITMSQHLQASASLLPGKYEIHGKITWQTCNSDICLQPVTEKFVTIIQIQ